MTTKLIARPRRFPSRSPEAASTAKHRHPFVAAYRRLRDFVMEGHTQEEVTEFAQQLNRELPQGNDIATAMMKIRAIGHVISDLNGETHE
ncbi:MAG TPA: hypothetical protein VFW64_06110 [Pseudonocardiaceae bacterium]|nr:hypothetical protein [Pseudonocardiaceae bacterium]